MIAAAITALIIAETSRPTAAKSPAAVTVTATPPAPTPPPPLPTTEADRQTCNAWHAAGDMIHAASKALSVLPPNSTIVDQAVRDNPEWSAAARHAADLYGQAGDTQAAGIASGSTPILAQTAVTAAAALRTLSIAEKTLDATNGNAYQTLRQAADSMDVLCERLASR